jgi:hypothetical protein
MENTIRIERDRQSYAVPINRPLRGGNKHPA